MDTKTTLPISQARSIIFDIAEQVQKPGAYYTLTEKGLPKAVIMSAEEFESWQETLEVMQEFPDLKNDIKETERDFKKGKYKTYVTLEQLLGKEGYIISDKAKTKYGVRRQNKAQRGKRDQKTS